jgi:hypothetical protein
MAVRKKIGLAVLLGLSLITGAAAFSKVVTNIIFSDVDPLTRGDQLFTLFGVMLLITSVEQSLVITIGCVPTLRPLVLIKIPMFKVIGDTLASLLSTRRSHDTPSKGSSRHNDQSQKHYENIELRNPYDTSREHIFPPLSTTDVHTETGTHATNTGKHIHRTDDYTVTYIDNTSAVRNVRC